MVCSQSAVMKYQCVVVPRVYKADAPAANAWFCFSNSQPCLPINPILLSSPDSSVLSTPLFIFWANTSTCGNTFLLSNFCCPFTTPKSRLLQKNIWTSLTSRDGKLSNQSLSRFSWMRMPLLLSYPSECQATSASKQSE